MIVFLATRGHQGTIKALAEDKTGLKLPKIVSWTYETLFAATRFPAATYIFADIERLQPLECRRAALVYRALRRAGLRCLNDPARVSSRYRLLRLLHTAGINPFDIYRADDPERADLTQSGEAEAGTKAHYPRPRRFPVFVRGELDHAKPLGDLITTQEELDMRLSKLVEAGRTLRGLVVVEFCGEPVAPGIWRKFGTYHIGDRIHVDHHVTEDKWTAKHGTPGLCPEWLYVIENETVLANRVPDAVAKAFELGCIEYGRADHSIVGGRDVVYEINTNPFIKALAAQRSPTRERTLAFSRSMMAEGFSAIDSGDGALVAIDTGPALARFRKAGTTAAAKP